MDRRVERFRREASRVAGAGTGRRYPESARAIALEYAREAIAGGEAVAGAASVLGITSQTLTYWLSKPPSRAALVPVEVIPDRWARSLAADGRIIVTLPNGIIVSGLGVDDAVEFVRGLR